MASAHLLRGLIGLATALCFFYAFSVMPLADAYAIAFAAPLMITALSVPLLGEAVGMYGAGSAVIVGFRRRGGDVAAGDGQESARC